MENQTLVQETTAKKTSIFTKWWFWFLIVLIAVLALTHNFLTNLFEDSNIVLYNDNDVVEQEEQPGTTENFEQDFVSWDSLNIPLFS
jgi:hypothetical protein